MDALENITEDSAVAEDEIIFREYKSPYKLCVFLLLTEIEKIQQLDDGLDVDAHAFLGILLTFLIRQKHMSLFGLKCFVLRFIEPLLPSLAENFFTSLRTHSQTGCTTNSDVLFATKRNPNFACSKSIIGMFARKVEKVNDKHDLLGHDNFNNYGNTAPTEEELQMMSKEWRFDISRFSQRIADIEEKFLDVVC